MKRLLSLLINLVLEVSLVACSYTLPEPKFKPGELMPQPRGEYMFTYGTLLEPNRIIEFRDYDGNDENSATFDHKVYLFCGGKRTEFPFAVALQEKNYFHLYLSNGKNRIIKNARIVEKNNLNQVIQSYIPPCGNAENPV